MSSNNNTNNENVDAASRHSRSPPRKILAVLEVNANMLAETDQQRKVTIQGNPTGELPREAVRVDDLNSVFSVFAKEMEDVKDKLDTTIKELHQTKKELEDRVTALEQETAFDADKFQWTIIEKDTRNAVLSVCLAICEIIPMILSYVRKTTKLQI